MLVRLFTQSFHGATHLVHRLKPHCFPESPGQGLGGEGGEGATHCSDRTSVATWLLPQALLIGQEGRTQAAALRLSVLGNRCRYHQ